MLHFQLIRIKFCGKSFFMKEGVKDVALRFNDFAKWGFSFSERLFSTFSCLIIQSKREDLYFLFLITVR